MISMIWKERSRSRIVAMGKEDTDTVGLDGVFEKNTKTRWLKFEDYIERARRGPGIMTLLAGQELVEAVVKEIKQKEEVHLLDSFATPAVLLDRGC